ncbi:MAG: histidine phosphatase family protein [Candidatus Omnitrophica bacterium]|nr:histidine phosphatase family protein [Candidatus Omnitrophota bacterium]
MKTLLLLRHAKSSWDSPELFDFDRPLNKRGLKQAPLMGQFMAKENLLPNLIITSTAKRATETTELLVKHSHYKGNLQTEEKIYQASVETLLKIIKNAPDKTNTLLIIGHNPGLELLAQALIHQSLMLKTCTLVKINLSVKKWKDIEPKEKATLEYIWKADEL